MQNKPIIKAYSRGATWLLVIYLSVALSGCTFRPDVLSPEEARVLQTRELSGTPEEVAKAVVVVLQEMHYTLGTVDMGLGVITAERSSERRLAPISKEPVSDTEIENGVKTFFVFAAVAVVIAFFIAIVFNGSDDDDEEDEEDEDDDRDRRRGRSGWFRPHRSGHRSSHVIIGGDSHSSYSPDSYLYTMTTTMEEITPMQTRIKVTVQGQHFDGNGVSESGPVQSQEFYTEFFSRLQTAMNR